jgi:hypothetical protein
VATFVYFFFQLPRSLLAGVNEQQRTVLACVCEMHNNIQADYARAERFHQDLLILVKEVESNVNTMHERILHARRTVSACIDQAKDAITLDESLGHVDDSQQSVPGGAKEQ